MSKNKPQTMIDPSLIEEAIQAVEARNTDSESGNDNKPLTDQQENQEETIKSSQPAKQEEDLQERFLRLAADFDNFRKRAHKEKTEAILYGNENLLHDLLSVLDNFDRALEHAKITTELDSVVTGVKMIHLQLYSILEKFGLKSLSSVGQIFDPTIHEAINHVPSSDHPVNTVLEELQKAYFLHKKLFRPARVNVVKALEKQDNKNTDNQNFLNDNKEIANQCQNSSESEEIG